MCKLMAVNAFGCEVTANKQFRDEPMTPVFRHWLCPKECGGEMVGTGNGITSLDTNWQHRCNKCGYEEWTDANYPGIVYNTENGGLRASLSEAW